MDDNTQTPRQAFVAALAHTGRVHQLALTTMGFTKSDRRWLAAQVKRGNFVKRPCHDYPRVTSTFHFGGRSMTRDDTITDATRRLRETLLYGTDAEAVRAVQAVGAVQAFRAAHFRPVTLPAPMEARDA